MSVFYDHLLDLAAAERLVGRYLPDPAERAQVLEVLDASLHHVVMETIFNALPIDAHELFLVQFKDNPTADHHLTFLRRYAPDIEEQIRERARVSQKHFLDAIHE